MDVYESLPNSLALERIEVNLFRGTTPESRGSGQIFGGQVIAQSLLAAYETVEDRVCHSLHCYFIRPGDPEIPILFEVDRARDGGSFTTRRVTAIQHGQQIFNLAASFQVAEEGLEHQSAMPPVPRPEDLLDEFHLQQQLAARASEEERDSLARRRPVELRWTEPESLLNGAPGEPISDVWFRAREPIGDDQRMHQAIMAFASDYSLLGTALRPHGLQWRAPGLQAASLDHAMWFHRSTDFTRWHLYHQVSPSAQGGRGFIRGEIYCEDGVLVASTAQEGLIRMRKPR
jgi:acyl-CoA thioesterase-2